MLQEIFLEPGCGEAVTPGAGKCRDKRLGEGKRENAPRLLALSPSWMARWKPERLGCRDRIPRGDVILLHPSECGGWTALDTSTMMSCSQPTSGQQWSLTHPPGRTESRSTGAHPARWAPWEQSAAHPTSSTVPALGQLWVVGDRQEPWAMQPSTQTLLIL